MTTGDLDLMRATFAKLTALGEGPFTLAVDVANVAKDKRKRHSSDLDAAPAILPAGSTWVLSKYGDTCWFWCKKHDVRARFQVREDDGIAWYGADDHSKGAVVARAILDALRATPRTIESVRASIENSALSTARGWDLITKLHEQGKISLDDIEAAAEAVYQDDNEPRDAS